MLWCLLAALPLVVAYTLDPITESMFVFRTSINAAEQVAKKQALVQGAPSADILLYQDTSDIIVQRGAVITNVFALSESRRTFFMQDLNMMVDYMGTRFNFIRFDSSFGNAVTFSASLPSTTWQYDFDGRVSGGFQGASRNGLIVIESNRTDPPNSFDRVVLVPFSVDPLNLRSPPVMGSVKELAPKLKFPDYRVAASILQNGKLVEWRKNWFKKDEVQLFIDGAFAYRLRASNAPYLASMGDTLLFPDNTGFYAGLLVQGQLAYKLFKDVDRVSDPVIVDETSSRIYWPADGLAEFSTCPNGCRTLADIDNWNLTRVRVAGAESRSGRFVVHAAVSSTTRAPLANAPNKCATVPFDQCACRPDCQGCVVFKAKWIGPLNAPSDRVDEVKGVCAEKMSSICASSFLPPTCAETTVAASTAAKVTSQHEALVGLVLIAFLASFL
jgi:hypothetical protein